MTDRRSFFVGTQCKSLLKVNQLAFFSRLLLVSLFIFPLLTMAKAEAASKFAYINVQKVIERSDARKSTIKRAKRKIGAAQKEIDALKAKIKKMRASLGKRRSLMTPDALNRENRKIKKMATDLQRTVEDHQASLDQENRAWSQRIFKAVHQVVKKIGQERQYTLIFTRGQVFYADPAIDITDTVLKRLNAQTKGWQ